MTSTNKRGKLGSEERGLFSDGEFFCTTADVWSKGTKAPQAKHWKKFWRPRNVNVQVRNNANAKFDGINTINPYKMTRDAIGETGARAAKPKTTRSESSGRSTNTNQQSGKERIRKIIWPRDIFGMPAVVGMEIAHLLPAGTCTLVYEEWFGVGAAVMGLPKTAPVRQQLMATRGVVVETEDSMGSFDDENSATAKKKRKAPSRSRVQADGPRKKRKGEMQIQALAKAPPVAAAAATSSENPPPAQRRMPRSAKSAPSAAASLKPEAAPEAAPPAKKPSASKKRRTALKQGGSYSEGDAGSKASISFDRDSVGSDPTVRRVKKTGVVHFVSNKIRLSSQKEVLDGAAPVMLIVPCMSLKSAKHWRGHKYEAVVLTGFPEGTTNIPDEYTEQYEGYTSADIARAGFERTGMSTKKARELYEEQKPRDQKEDLELVEEARQGLEEAVLGLTQYIKEMDSLDLSGLQADNREILQKRSKEFQARTEAIVPERTDDEPDKPPLIVSFAASNVETGEMHAAPDPLLLFAKAAVVWGKLTGTTILANGEMEDDDSDDLDEQAEEAEEAFCESFFTHDIPKEISVVTPGPISA